MKIRETVAKLEELLGIRIDVSQPYQRRWCIGGYDHYYDPYRFESDRPINNYFDTLMDLKFPVRTGIITGPESTTDRRFYKVFGTFFVPYSDDPATIRGEVYTASKLRNPRFSILYDN